MSLVAEALGVDPTTLSRLVTPLKKRKLLTSHLGKDKRIRVLRLTPQGEKLLIEAIPCWESAQTKVVSLYGYEGWSKMLHSLQKTSALVS